MRRFPIIIFALCLALTGCGTTPPNGAPATPPASRTESHLRSGDQLTVRLDTGGSREQAAQPPLELVVDENGEVSLPLIGRVAAAGSTPSELAERIQANYVPRYYVRCTATILPTIRFFYVGGEVRAPGRYNWTEDVTLLKAINTAGGFTDFANRRKVELARGKNKQNEDIDDIRQHPDKDVPIQPGDSIYVTRSIF